MRVVLLIIIGLHGLIHLLGFFQAFDMVELDALSVPISRAFGLLWLLAFVLISVAAIGYGLQLDLWWVIGIVAVVMSQLLIIYFWQDARWGTVANAILLLVTFAGFQAWHFKGHYKKDVADGIRRTSTMEEALVTEADLQPLPEPVRKYLRYVGVLNNPKVKNVKVVFEAEMRSKTQDWFRLDAEQHNFYDEYERLFYLQANVRGLPTQGYHLYKEGAASMNIKLLSTIPVVQVRGPEMFQAETVTLLNDMCFLAPATLIDSRISWEPLDSLSVRAIFSNREATVSAILYFNERGQLVNFSSDDRYDINEMKQYTFTTPLKDYREINGYRLAHYGEAVWHYPDGPFTYGRFRLKDVEYNVEGH